MARSSTVSIGKRLCEALKRIDRPGAYCTSGTVPAVLPGLEVGIREGVTTGFQNPIGSVLFPAADLRVNPLKIA